MVDTIATEDYVLWAYRLLLGRDPENLEALKSWPQSDRREIVAKFLGSAEFQEQYGAAGWSGSSERNWYISELQNGVRFWIRGDDRFISRSVASGDYEPVETAFIRRQVKKGMNVLDIGANVGWFTVNMAMLVGPAGRVDAFEPREDIVHYLRRTITENRLGNVVIHHCALGAENGSAAVTFAGDDGNPGGTYLVFSAEPEPGARLQHVPVRRLDSIVWSGVDFIKIDVEGAEKLVFDGAEILLSRDRPLILSEINEPALRRTSGMAVPDYLSYFAEIDYEVRTLLPTGRCGEPITPLDMATAGNLLSVACIPAEKSREVLLR